MCSHFFIYTRVEGSKSCILGGMLEIKRGVRKTSPRNHRGRSSPRWKQEHIVKLRYPKPTRIVAEKSHQAAAKHIP